MGFSLLNFNMGACACPLLLTQRNHVNQTVCDTNNMVWNPTTENKEEEEEEQTCLSGCMLPIGCLLRGACHMYGPSLFPSLPVLLYVSTVVLLLTGVLLLHCSGARAVTPFRVQALRSTHSHHVSGPAYTLILTQCTVLATGYILPDTLHTSTFKVTFGAPIILVLVLCFIQKHRQCVLYSDLDLQFQRLSMCD